MDRERILGLLAKLKQSRATEIELRDGDFRVRIVRAALAGGSSAAEAQAPAAAASEGAPAHHGVLVVSHVVGFFRRSRQPGDPPLAEVGQQVAKGQPIAVVEALRQAVAIEAPVGGTVLEFLADDGMRVEYATPLARLLPADAE